MNAVNVIFSSLSHDFVVKSVFVHGIRVFARKWQSPCDDVAEAATLCLCRIQPPLNHEFHIGFAFVFAVSNHLVDAAQRYGNHGRVLGTAPNPCLALIQLFESSLPLTKTYATLMSSNALADRPHRVERGTSPP